MNISTAKQILAKSITNLQKRRSNLTTADLETEIINNACLEILKKRKEKLEHSISIEDMLLNAFNSLDDTSSVSNAFTEAALDLFPNNYTEDLAIINSMGIEQNVAWDGMWDFLRDYFQKNHGFQIDNTEAASTIFYSTKHKRYENGAFTQESAVERTINISFINNKKEIIVSIEPSLSPKKGYEISKSKTQIQYKGYDEDYCFTIIFDKFDEVETFTLEMTNRKLKIVYFE